MNLALAKVYAGRLAMEYNKKSFFNGTDVGPTSDGRGFVLLLYAKSKPIEKIPKEYEGLPLILIDESEDKEILIKENKNDTKPEYARNNRISQQQNPFSKFRR